MSIIDNDVGDMNECDCNHCHFWCWLFGYLVLLLEYSNWLHLFCILHEQLYLSLNNSALPICCANSKLSTVVLLYQKMYLWFCCALHSDASPLYEWEDALVLRKVRNCLRYRTDKSLTSEDLSHSHGCFCHSLELVDVHSLIPKVMSKMTLHLL